MRAGPLWASPREFDRQVLGRRGGRSRPFGVPGPVWVRPRPGRETNPGPTNPDREARKRFSGPNLGRTCPGRPAVAVDQRCPGLGVKMASGAFGQRTRIASGIPDVSRLGSRDRSAPAPFDPGSRPTDLGSTRTVPRPPARRPADRGLPHPVRPRRDRANRRVGIERIGSRHPRRRELSGDTNFDPLGPGQTPTSLVSFRTPRSRHVTVTSPVACVAILPARGPPSTAPCGTIPTGASREAGSSRR